MSELVAKRAKRARRSGATQPTTTAPPRSLFLLVFNPRKWTVLEGEVVPLLSTMSTEPGINLVDRTGDMTLAEARQLRKGCTIIPEEWAPDGESYVAAWPGQRGSIVHTTVWEQCFANSSSVRSSDLPGYVAWLRELIDSGKLPDIEGHILEAYIDRAESALADATDKSAHSTRASQDMVTHQATLEVLRAKRDQMESVPLQPVKRSSRKRKPAAQ